MLEFKLNNKSFVLNTSASVRLSWRNPACQFKDITGDAGLGIDIPVNDTNRMLLGNPERFEKYASASDREFPGFEVRFSGKLLMSGTFIVQRANQQSYNGWLRGNLGNLKKEHQEKYLYEIEAFSQDVSFTNKANYDPDADDYACPEFYNPSFFYDKGRKIPMTREVPNPDYVDLTWWQDLFQKQEPEFLEEDYESEPLTEAWRITAEWMVNARNGDNTIKTADDTANVDIMHTRPLETYVVTPMLFLNYILKEAFKSSGFFIDTNHLADDVDLKKLILYNNYDITNMEFTVDPEGMVDEYFADGQIRSRVSPVTFITRNYSAPFRYRNLIPQKKLKDFLLNIQNLLNVCFLFKSDGRVDVIDREKILDGDTIDLEGYMVNNWEIGEQKDVTLKFTFEHDKDDTIFSEKFEDLDDRRNDIKISVGTLAELESIPTPKLGDIRYVESQNQYWQYTWVVDEEANPKTGTPDQEEAMGWQVISIGFQNGFYNDGKEEEEEIKTFFSTLTGSDPLTTQQQGNIESQKYSYINFSPRLLFYLGNNEASHKTGNISIDWKHDKGLLKKRWPKWARFWSQRQPVTGEANMPLNVIDYVVRNLTSKFRGREGEFIIEELDCEFSLNQIGISKITGYKI